MGDGNSSVSALAHFASCASVSHESSLRPSSDIAHSPFLGLCGGRKGTERTIIAARVHDGVVEGRRPCWSSDEAAPAGGGGGYNMGGAAAPPSCFWKGRPPGQKKPPPGKKGKDTAVNPTPPQLRYPL